LHLSLFVKGEMHSILAIGFSTNGGLVPVRFAPSFFVASISSGSASREWHWHHARTPLQRQRANLAMHASRSLIRQRDLDQFHILSGHA
jgi:hypothetical protein